MNRLLSMGLLAALFLCPVANAQDKVPAKPATKEAQPSKPAAKEGAKDATKPAKEPAKTDAPDTSAPGPEHKLLEQLAGTWQSTVKEFGPDGTASDAGTGEMTCSMTLGGRFLKQEFDGRYHGKFFRGSGMMGYNSTEKRWESNWADTMGTAMMFMTGKADAAGKVFTMTGESADPSGKKMTVKTVITVTGADTHKEEMFMVDGGKDIKMMEITYTKGKGEKGEKSEKSEKGEKGEKGGKGEKGK